MSEAQPQAGDGQVNAYTPDLDRLKKMFDDSRDATQDARIQSDIDRDYYDGKQLTQAERRILRRRKQPEIIINRVRRGVDGLLGVVEAGRTDPRAYMRNPPKPEDAGAQQPPQPMVPGQPAPAPAPKPDMDAGDVASLTLRYIADSNHFQSTKMDVLENMLIEGAGAAVIEIGEDQNVIVTQIRWEEFFFDPRSRRADFHDARYVGVAKWMYADFVAAIYPEKAEALADFATSGSIGGFSVFDVSWEDRPDNLRPWIDRVQRRIMVVEIYHQEGGQWMRCVYWAGGILEAAPSPYKDEKGHPLCPIEAQSGYVDRENRRYGMVRDMRGPQDEINMRRSKLLHLLNARQVQQVDPTAPPMDADSARVEAARPDGVLPPGWNIVPTTDMATGQANLLAEAKSEIERLGPNPAILGRQDPDASGRAQQVRQQAGMTELGRLLGRFNRWELRVYKQMWNRARQFWTAPKWIRVTDDEGAPQYVMVNEPTPAVGLDPATGQPIPGKPKNHVADMDVDIVVDAVPDTANLQAEVFQDLVQLAGSYGPGVVPFKVLLQMSPLPRKRELIDMLEQAQADAAQQQQAANAQKIQLLQAQAEADIAETNSKAARNYADAQRLQIAGVRDASEAHVALTTPPPGLTGAPVGQPSLTEAPPA